MAAALYLSAALLLRDTEKASTCRNRPTVEQHFQMASLFRKATAVGFTGSMLCRMPLFSVHSSQEDVCCLLETVNKTVIIVCN
jgi:hypothetical protein